MCIFHLRMFAKYFSTKSTHLVNTCSHSRNPENPRDKWNVSCLVTVRRWCWRRRRPAKESHRGITSAWAEKREHNNHIITALVVWEVLKVKKIAQKRIVAAILGVGIYGVVVWGREKLAPRIAWKEANSRSGWGVWLVGWEVMVLKYLCCTEEFKVLRLFIALFYCKSSCDMIYNRMYVTFIAFTVTYFMWCHLNDKIFKILIHVTGAD